MCMMFILYYNKQKELFSTKLSLKPLMKFFLILWYLFFWNGPVFADDFSKKRHAMVGKQIVHRGITDDRVLEAMRTVPRHFFVRPSDMQKAYLDHPLPIGENQTISQPYIVAFMTELLNLKGEERVLEVGTGSGYQAAILSRLCKEVYSVEIIKGLHERAARLFQEGGYKNIFLRHGDGYRGWKEKAPFDAIIITAAAGRIPDPLVKQLKDGGIMVLPVGRTRFTQTLTVITKKGNALDIREVLPVIFVPMTGEIEENIQ